MSWLINLIVTWVVTAVSLLIIAQIPVLGVEIDNFKKALTSAAVFGILNVILSPILGLVFFLPNLFTLFLLRFIFAAIANAIVFGLASVIVNGFRLRNGVWSALFGAIVLSLVNRLIFAILPITG